MIQGKRVRLRAVERDDQAFIHELNSDANVRQNVVGWAWPSSLHRQEEWFNSAVSEGTQRLIVENADGQALGITGLWDIDWHNRHALTALKLGGRSVRLERGLGTDAIMTVMAFAFYDVGLHRLYSTILTRNKASIGAYVRKCGWTIEGTSRQHIWRAGSYHDLHHVGILKEDFDQLSDADEYRSLVAGNML